MSAPEMSHRRPISRREAADLRAQGLKRCPMCEETKPLDDFGLSASRGHQSYCLACVASRTSGSHKRAAALRARGLKRCSKCEEAKPLADFHQKRGTADGRGYRCASCLSSGARRRIEELRANGLKRCPGCREVKSLDHFSAHASNRDGRQVRCIACARSYRASPEGRASSRAAGSRRRDRDRKQYCGCDTTENLHAVWILDEGRCAYCDAPGTDYEHVVPSKLGGWGCISNFRIACRSCNTRKGTKPLSVFLDRLAASGVQIRPGATNSGLPCPAAAARMATRMLTA